MYLKKITLSIVCITCFVLIHGQSLPFEKYTSKNGLISDRITAIAQDDEGFMWFGSYFGICRYNGLSFEKLELPSQQQNRYVTFLGSANGKMYAGFLFSGGLAEWTQEKVNVHFIKGKDSALANEFTCMYNNRDGSILLGNRSGQIYSFKEGKFSLVYSIKKKAVSPLQLLKDQYNNIWLSTEEGLFIVPHPYQYEYFYFNEENIFSLARENNKKIWFNKTDGKTSSILCCDGWKDGNISNLKTVTYSGSIKAVPFYGNMQKGYWSVDQPNGIVHIAEGDTPVYYKLPLDYNTDITAVFADRESNIWVANEPGICKVSNFNAQSYLFDQLAVGGGTLAVSNEKLWAANARSLYTINSNQLQKKSFSPLSSMIGQLFIDSKKNLWFSLWNDGVWRSKWEDGKLVNKEFYLNFGSKRIKATSIIEDGEGNIWMGGSNGIFQFRNNKLVDHYTPTFPTGEAAAITAMVLDEKNKIFWLGDNTSGIVKVHYELIGRRKAKFQTVDFIDNKDGLDDGSIRSLLYDGKDLWAGTRLKGIYRIHEEGNQFRVTNCNTSAGLSCTRVTDIKMQKDKAIWFATCNGVYRYDYLNNKWTHLNTSDGILNAEVFSIVIDENKKALWALTAQGITKLLLNSSDNSIAPLVNLVAVAVSGKVDSTALYANHHNYSSQNNSISFSFIGASFIDEKNIRYKYMLQGYDKSWSEPVALNTVNYASLTAGSYVFKVMAQNAKGQWSETPASFSFQIVTPFYKRSWFVFLLITIAFTIVYLVRMQRLKNKFKIEKLRLSIARDLHDDVGATLGSINILSKTATRKLEKVSAPEEINSIFQKIGHSAEQTLEAMDDIVWSINPDKDKMQDLFVRMREYAIPLLEAKDIAFQFKTEGDLSHSISMNLRRNLFLIFKESVHNILKHSGAQIVTVLLEIRNGHLYFTINDNGKGFQLNNGTINRNGLKNMHQRAQMINGVLKIDSFSNGTSIRFHSPLR